MCDWKYKVKCVGRKELAQMYQLPKMSFGKCWQKF
jgi:hypothetical protein